jgi:hypothetical protein
VLIFADPLARGYPAPPLAPKAGKLYDAWFHKPVELRGVSWFGFNNAQGGPDGLWAGGSEAATDFGAIAYQLKLLGELQAVKLHLSGWCCIFGFCELQTC